MTNFIARDIDTGAVIADRVTVATRRADRAIGLLGRRRLDPGEALWIKPCHGVHTWFMRFSIDVLALDEDGVIVDAVSVLKPWRIRLPRPGACSVLELPAGTLLDAQARLGRRIEIEGPTERFGAEAVPRGPAAIARRDTAAILQGQTGK